MTPSTLALALVLSCAALAKAQAPPPEEALPTPPAPVPPPAALAGTWVGSFAVTFALADASNPNSWECLPAGTAPIRVQHSMTFSPDGTVSDSP